MYTIFAAKRGDTIALLRKSVAAPNNSSFKIAQKLA